MDRSLDGRTGVLKTVAIRAPLFALAVALCATVAVLPGWLLPYYVGGLVFAALGLFCLGAPFLLIYFVILSSALAGLLRIVDSLQIGGGGVSLSGVRWAVIFALTILVIVANVRRLRVPGVLIPFFVLVAWATVRFAVTPLGVSGAKDLIFYALPPLLAVYALLVVRAVPDGLLRLERAILYSAFLPVLIYVVLFGAGQVQFTEAGPQGLIGPRTVAAYLLVALALALALHRYSATKSDQQLALLVISVALITIFFTISRTASVTALALLLVSRMRPYRPWRLALRGLALVGLTFLLIWNVPAFRARTFRNVEEGLAPSLSEIRAAGRETMWPLTFIHAIQRPVVGWGPGTARVYLAGALGKGQEEEEHHPHNEFLQVFHDLGAVGLIIVLGAWGTLVVRRWRDWIRLDEAGDVEGARWSLASLLVTGAILLPALTGNTFHYPFVMGPAFIIIAIPECWNPAAHPAPGRRG